MNLDDTIDDGSWEYTGAGAANVVFGYMGNNVQFKGKVIRLRLNKSDISTSEIYSYLTSSKFDKLKKYMVNIDMVDISNKFLYYIQNQLDNQKKNLLLNMKERQCLIMDNIFSGSISKYKPIELSKYHKFFLNNIETEIIFEFKPKWLYQMPASHINCRNCLIARAKGQEFIPCHLKLINDSNGIFEWCKEIANEFSTRSNSSLDIYDLLKVCITKNYEILKLLYELQNSLDVHNALLQLKSEEDVSTDLQFNMTLRDLSIFMKLNENKVYLIDLDKKSSKKWKKWQAQEKQLEKYYSDDLDLDCRIETNP